MMQLVVIGLFLSLATYFWLRCRRHGVHSTKLNQALLTLYMSNGLILTRSIYRTVEFFEVSSGQDWDSPDFHPSPILRYEALFYIFEASLMLCNSVLLNVRHPRRFLPHSTAPETPSSPLPPSPLPLSLGILSSVTAKVWTLYVTAEQARKYTSAKTACLRLKDLVTNRNATSSLLS